MTQAQLDLQTQLDQNATNITTSPLFIDSPVLFLESVDQSTTTTHNTATHTYEQTEQVEHHSLFQKHPTLLEIFTVDNAHERPPPPKKKYEIMKDPSFLSSPLYATILPTKCSFCTIRDDHLMQFFHITISQSKHNSLPSIRVPTTTRSNSLIKIRISWHLLLRQKQLPTNNGLTIV